MAKTAPLNRMQERALAALLTCKTIEDAATKAEVHIRTVYKWLALPTFKASYLQARREAMGQVIGQLQQTATVAVRALREVLDDPAAPHTARVSASRTVLELALRAMELEDLAQRIEALETHVMSRCNGRTP
jgi:hypothetical protein